MANDLSQYSLLERSAIHEMANIGLGHAMTSLSDMTGHSFSMSVPSVDAISLEEVPNMVGDCDAVTVGIYMSFEGDVRGHMAFLFPWISAQALWSMLLGQAPKDVNDIDELAASAMLETGNIINSSFMNAISEMTDLDIHATPPLFSVDSCSAIVSSIVAEAALGETIALAIKTKIYETESGSTEGHFLCIPEKESLELFFEQLKVRTSA